MSRIVWNDLEDLENQFRKNNEIIIGICDIYD